MRGGMEYYLRLIILKNTVKPVHVAYRADLYRKIKLCAVFSHKLLLYIVCIVLINIKDDELFDVALRKLSAKLTSDRAATARDKHGLTFIIIKFTLIIYFIFFRSKYVSNGKITHKTPFKKQ